MVSPLFGDVRRTGPTRRRRRVAGRCSYGGRDGWWGSTGRRRPHAVWWRARRRFACVTRGIRGCGLGAGRAPGVSAGHHRTVAVGVGLQSAARVAGGGRGRGVGDCLGPRRGPGGARAGPGRHAVHAREVAGALLGQGLHRPALAQHRFGGPAAVGAGEDRRQLGVAQRADAVPLEAFPGDEARGRAGRSRCSKSCAVAFPREDTPPPPPGRPRRALAPAAGRVSPRSSFRSSSWGRGPLARRAVRPLAAHSAAKKKRAKRARFFPCRPPGRRRPGG